MAVEKEAQGGRLGAWADQPQPSEAPHQSVDREALLLPVLLPRLLPGAGLAVAVAVLLQQPGQQGDLLDHLVALQHVALEQRPGQLPAAGPGP